MQRRLLLLFLLVLSLPIVVSAYPNSTTWCLATDVSQIIANGTVSENVTCGFGCNSLSGKCNPDPYSSDNWLFYLMFPGISLVLLYFSSLLKEEDWPIHLLLIVSALFFLVAPLGVLSSFMLKGPMTALYWLSITIMFFVTFYYILKIIIRAVGMMSKK